MTESELKGAYRTGYDLFIKGKGGEREIEEEIKKCPDTVAGMFTKIMLNKILESIRKEYISPQTAKELFRDVFNWHLNCYGFTQYSQWENANRKAVSIREKYNGFLAEQLLSLAYIDLYLINEANKKLNYRCSDF